MLNLSLHERFANAERHLQDARDNIPENLKMKLYGLSKQAKEGDCRMPMPPSTNTVLRAKWDAWTAYAGYENEKAMLEYVSLIDRLDTGNVPAVKEVSFEKPNTVRRSSLKPGQILMKQGTLYKQRDVFKGWRPRHFVLIDNTLTYFIEGEEGTPKGTLALSGCTCVAATPTMSDGVEYFPFVLTHPGNSKPYNLSAISKADADDWIAKINLAAKAPEVPAGSAKQGNNRRATYTNVANSPDSIPIAPGADVQSSAPSSVPFKPNPSTASSVSAPSPANEGTDSAGKEGEDGGEGGVAAPAGNSILKPEAVMKNIPPHLTETLEKKISEMFDAISPGAPGWEIFMDKDGVKGLKRPGSGDLSAIRADALMPYNILDVFQCVTSVECLMIMDPMRKQQDKLKILSNHSWIEYFRFREVWPISARDFVDLSHWRLLADGTVVILSFSSKFDDLKPPVSGLVRGETSVAGYILKPAKSSGGTEVHFLVETDPKGSLPTSIVNQVSLAQPKALINAKQILEKKKLSNSLLRSPTASVAYQDFIGVITANVAGTGGGAAGPTPTSAVINAAGASGSGAPAPVASKGLGSLFPSVAASNNSSSGASGASSPPPAPSAAAQAVSSRLKDIKGHEYVLVVFLVPVVLYYTIGGYTRSVAFMAAFIFAAKYLLQQHMGTPVKKSTHGLQFTQIPAGRTVVRIPVDLGHLLKYLDTKRGESKVEVTITHITVKACAAVLSEMPTLNGHVMMGEFYKAKSLGVDVSYSLDLTDRESILLKIADADVKSVDSVANEIIQLGKKTREDTKRPPKATLKSKLLDMLSPSISESVDKFLTDLGQLYGINLPALGIEAFPAGVCSVITSPSMEGDADVEVSVIPNSNAEHYSPPIVVSIGSVRVLAALDQERKVNGSPVLNYSISFDNRAASVVECRKFCAKLQKYLRNPAALEVKPSSAPAVPENPARRKSFLK